MITYVTGNKGKYLSVKRRFGDANIEVDFYSMDLKEPDINDIKVISKSKVMEAYEVLQSPCFVADSGFYIEDYPGEPGYPGAFVKRSGISSDVDKLLKTMEGVENRKCMFMDCLTYYDGKEIYQFFGESKGTLAYEKRGIDKEEALSNLWYIFIPNNHDKTLAEMTTEERLNRKDGNINATDVFIKWYSEQKRMKLI